MSAEEADSTLKLNQNISIQLNCTCFSDLLSEKNSFLLMPTQSSKASLGAGASPSRSGSGPLSPPLFEPVEMTVLAETQSR